jgi:hypothetical protein
MSYTTELLVLLLLQCTCNGLPLLVKNIGLVHSSRYYKYPIVTAAVHQHNFLDKEKQQLLGFPLSLM